MKQFSYTVKDENGIHARPAGLLVKCAKTFLSEITIERSHQSAPLQKLFALLALNIKQGETVTITAQGDDEEAAIAALQAMVEANF